MAATDPLRVIREATKAVPAVRYALGVAGVAAAVAIVVGFQLDPRIAVFGTLIMLLLMVLLILVARVAGASAKQLLKPVLVLVWSVLAITIVIATFLVSSIFLRWPLDLKEWISGSSDRSLMTFTATLRLTLGEGTLDCRAWTDATATITIDRAYHAHVDPASCLAMFPDLAIALKEQVGKFDLEGAPNFAVPAASQRITVSDRPIIVKLEAAAVVPRVRVAVLPFQSVSPSLQADFERFCRALRAKIGIVSEALSGHDPAFAYLRDAEVVTDGPASRTPNQLAAFWAMRHMLQLVEGLDIQTESDGLTVQTRVFLGGLAPKAEQQTLSLRVRLTSADFDSAQDGQSALFLYALGRDAEQRHLPNDVVAALFGQALLKLDGLGALSGDLAEVRAAARATLAKLRETGGPS